MKKFNRLSKKEKAEYIAIIALYPLFVLFSFLGKTLMMFGTKKRQIMASVLSFTMIIAMIPMVSMTAFAQTGSTTKAESTFNKAYIPSYDDKTIATVSVSSWAELQSAINASSKGSEIMLTQDIVAGSGDQHLQVPSNVTATIDLNGKKIDRNMSSVSENGNVFDINGSLTINDTSTAKTGKITGGQNNHTSGGVNVVGKRSSFTMNGGSITGNTSKDYGGGVFVFGDTSSFTMNGGNITGNTAINGGGVYVNGYKSSFTMNGGNITGNTAIHGGGVYVFGDTSSFTMNDGSITGNKAGVYGGGVHVTDTSSFTMNGGSITGNKAEVYGGGVFDERGMTLSGNASIIDNHLTSGKPNNLYLYDTSSTGSKRITVANPLGLGSQIGFRGSYTNYPVTIANGTSEYALTADDVAKFKSDIDGYEIALSNGDAVLKKTLGTLQASNFTYTPQSDLIYSGTAKTATVTAKDGISCAAPTVKFYNADGTPVLNPIDVGTYTVKIDVEANENYNAITDLVIGNFTITAKTLAKSDLTVTGIDDEIYTGDVIKPVPIVKYGNATLAETADYTLSYGTNSAIGKGTVTVNLCGNYSGSATYEFNINYGTATTDWYLVNKPSVNGWYNADIIISAKGGYTISKSPTSFGSNITIDTETENGSQEFYLKASDKKIYKSNISYKLDKTSPTDVKIQYNKNGFKSFLNTITFGLFFRETVDVEAQAKDALSGIDTVWYYASDNEVTDTSAITAWQNSLSLTKNNKKIVYIKATDKAGNSTIVLDQGIVVYSDSTVTPTTVAFDLNAEKQKNIDITMILNDNTLREIKNGSIVLANGTDYTVSGNTVTISKAYLNDFASGTAQTLTFVFNPMGVAGDTTTSATVTVSIDDTTHVHSGTYHDRVEATCIKDGNVEYWSCSCGKNFSDSACTNEITNVVISKLGHSFGTPTYTWDGDKCTAERTCTRAGCTEKETEIVTASAKVTQQKTCTQDELSTYTATFTNKAFATQIKENIKTADKLGHDFTGALIHDETYHWHCCSHEGCIETDTKIAHDYSIKGTETPATYFADGERVDTCICGATNTVVLPKLVDTTAPTIVEGEGGTFTQGGKNGLTFKSTAALSDFISVLVDGNVIGTDKYTTSEGSTIVTLKSEYLESLSAGKHTLDIKSVSGTASTDFTIESKKADNTKPTNTSKPEDTQPPQTGDTNDSILRFALLVTSGGALTMFGILKKRRKVNSK